MTEMVERVARAIATSVGGRIVGPGQSIATREFGWKGGDGKHLDQYVEAHWKEHVHAAEFAIAAMPLPNDDYFAAVVKALGCRNDEAHRDAVRKVHQMWIDEALK